jgi:hypothetical protein
MARQGFDLQLTRYDERGWRATFYTTGMEHSPTSATGTGWERTPWRATQRAVRAANASTRPTVDHARYVPIEIATDHAVPRASGAGPP